MIVGCGIFVSDVTSEVVFGSFWFVLPGLGASAWTNYFTEVFIGN